MITADLFSPFFRQVHGGQAPFPWQSELLNQIIRGEWPGTIALPTAAGKTALIDLAVFALAAGAPGAARRIFFVVDRRVVVDEAAQRADKISRVLASADPDSPAGRVAAVLRTLAGPDAGDLPLYVATLRGGMPRNDTWARSPLQPTVCCSTVDQVGSSLLFRAYGSPSNRSWSIRAGLASNDALLIVDEAHTAQPFLETLAAIERYRAWKATEAPTPVFRVIEMSATPRTTGKVFTEGDADRAPGCPLHARWGASKPTRLVVAPVADTSGADGSQFQGLIDTMVRQARLLREAGSLVIGVIANRVGTARRIHEKLRRDDGARSVLFTGRSRPFDRACLWNEVESMIVLGRQADPEEPIYVVATQCLEVGANVDFEALVTEAAAIDALEQRFGRLNRNGRSIRVGAAIVAQKDQTAAKHVDAVYGPALSETWRWLSSAARSETTAPTAGKAKRGKALKRQEPMIDMGVDALRARLSGAARESMETPRPQAVVALPAHLDRLSETSPIPAASPDPALFLHGLQSGPPDLFVVWRADLNEGNMDRWAELVARFPPRPEEMMAMPVWAVRTWLAQQNDDGADISDLEGQTEAVPREAERRPILWWRGPEETEAPGRALVPGSIVVVPADYGGCDQWGWNPDSLESVRDVAELVSLERGTPFLRLDPAVIANLSQEAGTPAIAGLRSAETAPEIRQALTVLTEALPPDSYLVRVAMALRASRRIRQFRGEPNEEGMRDLAAIGGVVEMDQASAGSSFTVPVGLEQHLESCARRIGQYAHALALSPTLAKTLVMAARLHDIGKADLRFQSWLRGGAPVSEMDLPLAKSEGNSTDRRAREAARRRSGYPRGARHEIQSLALILSAPVSDPEVDAELLYHLIGSHHGHCRPFAPVVVDSAVVEVRYGDRAASSKHCLEAVDSGIAERFWRLTRRYGWWGLAWLESLLRLADQRQSEAEQEWEDAWDRKEEAIAVRSY
jgi:CRISPR-associated endonuclease/helicase Cas3